MLHRFKTSIANIPLPERFTYPFCYTPHPLCVMAAEEVQHYLNRQHEWKEELSRGKMFGVLVVQTGNGEVGYLAAFSGILAGKNQHSYFVPPVYDLLQPQGFFIHDTYNMPTIVTNCSNNYGPYQFPEKLIPLFINNIRCRKPLPVYGKGENVRDWLYVIDHVRGIDLIFHKGKIAETYNIGGFNEWKNIDIIKVLIKTVDRLLGYPEGYSLDLITYVSDRKGHDLRYAIDSAKLKQELGWEPSLQFEEGLERTVRWYLDNEVWMDNVTSGDYQEYYDSIYRNE